jgi:hypothetical protein
MSLRASGARIYQRMPRHTQRARGANNLMSAYDHRDQRRRRYSGVRDTRSYDGNGLVRI